MRLLHTADWHLGKSLKGQSMLDDQIFILNQLFDIIDEQKPEAILICGDIYDRNIPPAAAVELFSNTLTKFVERNLPTLIIAGNHDSATRLNFGSKIFERQDIYIATKDPAQVVLKDKFGEIYFSLIPFKDEIEPYVAFARNSIPRNKRSIALAHVFLAGGIKSESERKFVGGAANVDANVFSGYNYAALGHLHSPQKFYSGSPLKYSFDEVDHKKSVTIVDIDELGNVTTKEIPFAPSKDLVVIEGTFNELVNRPPIQDYAQIILTDDAYIYETEDLRDAFPNFLEIKRKSHLKSYDDEPKNTFRKEDTISEQFSKFFTEIMSEPLTEEEMAAFEKTLKEIEMEDRE